MEPLTLTLLGYPLSILANVTYDQAKKIRDRISDFSSIERLFIKCFYDAIKEHEKHYDNYASDVLKKLKKEVKKDEKKFLILISDNGNFFITSFERTEFNRIVALKVTEAFSLDTGNYSNLVVDIVTDCFSYYIRSFYNLMNEKEGIQAILTECLKLNQILDLLININNQIVTKNEFDNLRKIVFEKHLNSSNEYKKRLEDYDSYITNKFKYLELRGFSPKISGKEVQMELDDIFVPLSINKQQRIVPNILENDFNNPNDNTYKSIDILNHRALVILGDPGSGKSTLLKYLASQIIVLRKSEHILKNIIPVFFRLSDYSDFYKTNKKSIYEFITNHFDIQYQHIYKENFEFSNLLILMDGLDEIAETPLRLKVTEQVMDLMARYPNNRYYVTSRIVGYQESKLGGAFIQYKLLPFRKEEIELFANQWYKSIASHTDENYEHAAQQASNLYNSIYRNPSVLKLATNPLLMTIISMIHYQGKKLPSKRIELYEISTETFLEHWVQLRITDEKQLKDKAEIIEILAPIAFEIHNTKSNALIEEEEFQQEFLKNFQSIHTNTSKADAKLTCKEFIQFLRQQTGFFYEKGVDDGGNRYFGFMHLTFEEYLAAIELVSKWNENEIKLENFIFQPRWTEIIRLAASQIRLSFKGKAGRTQTSNFIKDLLQVNDDFKDAHRPIQLVCMIISDDVSIIDDLQNDIFNSIIEILSNDTYPSLVDSFSKLFFELFLCDKHNYFIERIRESLKSHNETLIRNLTKVLCYSHAFTKVESLLNDNLNNNIIIDEIISIEHSHPMRKTDFMKNIFIKYLSQTKIQFDDEENYWKFRTNVLGLIDADEFLRKEKDIDTTKVKIVFDQIKEFNSFKYVTKVFNDYLLTLFVRNKFTLKGVVEIAEILPKKYSTNLINSLEGIDGSIFEGFTYNKASSFYKNKVHGIFCENQKGLVVLFWDTDFIKLEARKFTIEETDIFLDSMKDIYDDLDINTIKNQVFYINGPLRERDNLKNFINSYETNSKMFDFFGWEDFPFFEMAKEPKIMSEIVIKNSRRYLRIKDDEDLKEKIDFNSFCKLDIPSPVKLILSIKTTQPYNTALIENSIDYYYNRCQDEYKSGVFEILYNVINITNTTDNIL